MKNYIGISRDHSASMRSISKAAARDFNSNIKSIQEAARSTNLDTIISVVKSGVGLRAIIERETTNSNVHVVSPINEKAYITDGYGTPLFDSIGDLIETLSAVPDASDPEVSFLVMAITDGEENSSKKWSAQKLSEKIRELQATDRWTFVFRVPRGYARSLMRFGIPEGNILEWDQSDRGVALATVATDTAMASYFVNRTAGVKSTTKFYADLSKVSVNEVKQTLTDISNSIARYQVPMCDDGVDIKSFIERHETYRIGSIFYQLSKPEKVQEAKQICIRDKSSGSVYGGRSARDLLGLPHYGAIRLVPGMMGNYDVFVQSTSVNRKLVGDTTVLYCPMFAR